MVATTEIESDNNNNNNRKRKRVLKQQQQIKVLSEQAEEPNLNKPSISIVAKMETMSYRFAGLGGGKKNQHIKLFDNVKIHNYWGNIFRRKAIMGPYFSETAFGSDIEKKIEYRELWKDPEYKKKYLPQDYLDSATIEENELK